MAASPLAFPLTIAFLTLISFGLLIPLMGFYWDDWPFIWLAHIVTPFQLTFLEVQRPLTGWLFALVKPVLLDYPLRWQIFNLAMRWLLGYAMGWAITQVWPERKEEAAWTALVFLLYPGFIQQNISVNSSRQLLPLAMLLISFGLTARACRVTTRRQLLVLSGISMVLSTTSMLTTDYYLSLEIIRPILIWIVLQHASKGLSRLTATLLAWLPNLIPSLLVIIWRFFFTRQLYYPISIPQILAASHPSLINLIGNGLHDLADAAVLVWLRIFSPVNPADIGSHSMYIYWAVVVGAGLAVMIYLAALKPARRPGFSVKDSWWKSALLIGAVALVAGALPAWSIGWDPSPGFPQDRLYLPMMLGASLVLVGLLRLLPFRDIGIAILAIVLALAAGHHFDIASTYRWDWSRQKALFWQLAWRIPGLSPGTTLLTDDLSFDYETDNSITAPINWMYAPTNTSDAMSYIVFDVKSRPWLDPVITGNADQITRTYREFAAYRSFHFAGSLSKVLVIYQNYPACLRVVQPFYDQYTDDYSSYVAQAFQLSNPGLIQPSPAQVARPPSEIFGAEPGKDWCYYYEKADLARQFGRWDQVAALGNAALKKLGANSPGRASEYLVFVEGYGRAGNYNEAEKLTGLTIQQDKNLDRMLCAAWERIDKATGPSESKTTALQWVRSTLSCKSQ